MFPSVRASSAQSDGRRTSPHPDKGPCFAASAPPDGIVGRGEPGGGGVTQQPEPSVLASLPDTSGGENRSVLLCSVAGRSDAD